MVKRFLIFQLQRNILATCPRVTRFKIDWGDGEDAENLPPSASTESESNQMAVDGEASTSQKPTDRLEAALKGENLTQNSNSKGNIIISGSSTDHGHLNGAAAMETEPMQM